MTPGMTTKRNAEQPAHIRTQGAQVQWQSCEPQRNVAREQELMFQRFDAAQSQAMGI